MRLRAGDPRSCDVARVELDGVTVSDVVELDDAEGWLVRFTGEVTHDHMVEEKLTGNVEVFFR